MFRLLSTLITLGALTFGGWWVWNNVPLVRHFAERHIDTAGFSTLEARYTAEQIMNSHQRELLPDAAHAFGKPKLEFHPYVLMEVKYTHRGRGTREGVILWSLEDGEMVISGNSWELTHGFEDCLNAHANTSDFRVLSALARNDGALRREALMDYLHVEGGTLDRWLESCMKKKLVVQNGGLYRLHFQKPRLNVSPETELNQSLVTKPYTGAQRVPKRYSVGQIEKLACNAFGEDFTVRNSKEVFLPVYSISVQNPDGSTHTSYWNALNGKRINKSLF